MKRAELLPAATLLASLLILWTVYTMRDEITEHPPRLVPTGETHASHGITTPRYYLPGTRDREPASVWVRRHADSVAAFEAGPELEEE